MHLMVSYVTLLHMAMWLCSCSLQMCIQNNPNEARNMLLQNPQLAYALLQAQIVMKIVDPQVALVSFQLLSEATQASQCELNLLKCILAYSVWNFLM